MIEISFHANVKEISKKLTALAYQELPFATARALTELAREAQAAERAGMESVFDKPKPFTLNSVRVFGATKDTQTAGVFVMDKAENYLSPFEDNGQHFINVGQTSLHVPVQAPKDAGGNLRRNFERNQRGKGDTFFGVVQTKQGPINGLWQRTKRFEVRDKKGRLHTAASLRRGYTHNSTNGKPKIVKGLRLLVRYVGNKPVKERPEFHDRGEKLIRQRFDAVMGRELSKAIASSKFKVG